MNVMSKKCYAQFGVAFKTILTDRQMYRGIFQELTYVVLVMILGVLICLIAGELV